jgi:hypothetical protein
VQKIHAVIGGFHLAPYPEEYVRQTVSGLSAENVDYVIPLHCTGDVFHAIAGRASFSPRSGSGFSPTRDDRMDALGFARYTLRLGEAERDGFVERSRGE